MGLELGPFMMHNAINAISMLAIKNKQFYLVVRLNSSVGHPASTSKVAVMHAISIILPPRE